MGVGPSGAQKGQRADDPPIQLWSKMCEGHARRQAPPAVPSRSLPPLPSPLPSRQPPPTWFLRKRRTCSTRKRGSLVMRKRRRPAGQGGGRPGRRARVTGRRQSSIKGATSPLLQESCMPQARCFLTSRSAAQRSASSRCCPADDPPCLMSSFTVWPSNFFRMSKMGTWGQGGAPRACSAVGHLQGECMGMAQYRQAGCLWVPALPEHHSTPPHGGQGMRRRLPISHLRDDDLL